MFANCLVCHAPFPENRTLERFPVSRRVAYDPARGRLWAVCGACRRWTLAPMEERWEALEELEKAVTDEARLLTATDNISLLRHGDVEIVRVGTAELAEEAWWRYGRELLTRRRRHRKVAAAGTLAAGALWVGGLTAGVSILAIWWGAEKIPGGLHRLVRWLHFGPTAWRGEQVCPDCGSVLEEIPFGGTRHLVLAPGREEGFTLRYRCVGCRRPAGFRFEGPEAEGILRRSLGYHHHSGASEERVTRATRLIEEVGSPRRLTEELAGRRQTLADLDRTGSIALEIAANEDQERRLLELEAAELEARWREEEALASIVDGELTPMPMLEQIRRRVAAGIG